MKRVRVIAVAVPAALGMTIPAVAHAAATTHGPRVRSQRLRPDVQIGTKCISGGLLNLSSSFHNCFVVGGNGNVVDHMNESHWSNPGYGLVGYKDVAGYPAKSKWRDTKLKGGGGEYYISWGPGCSFPTNTHVYGYTTYHKPTTALSWTIKGSNFTGKKKCA